MSSVASEVPALPPFAASAASAASPLVVGPGGRQPPRKNPQEERRAQLCLYLARRVRRDGSGKLERGALRDAASEFEMSLTGVQGLWVTHKNAILEPDKYALDVSRRKGSGNKGKMTAMQVRAAVRGVPCRYRHSLRALAEKTGIPKSTLCRYLKMDDGILSTKGGGGGEFAAHNDGGGAEAARGSSSSDDNAPGTRSGEIPQDELKEAFMKRRIQEELREHYKREVGKAVECAKREAEREHNKHLEELRRGLQQKFDSEKDEVLHQLRVEMHRHQLELNRLKDKLGELGGWVVKEKEGRDEEGGSG